jgi:polyhydroxybutyrate depolymerase
VYFKFICLSFIIFFITSCEVGSNTSATSTSDEITFTMTPNSYLSNYQNAIDTYFPSNATSAIIFLHGGGGKKEGLENDFGFKVDDTTTNYDVNSSGKDWLISNKVMAIFPQGQTITGYSAWTWNNYVMTSGYDDIAFLNALVSSIKNNSSYSKITKFYLVGHSNGGMMANRMWCESPSTFDAYVSLAGPPSSSLNPTTGSSPCAPTSVRPYMGIIGDHDTVISTTSKMSNSTWTINPVMRIGNTVSWINPIVINDKIFHTTRVSLKCGTSVNTPTTNGTLTTYSDCSDSLRFVIVSQSTVNSSANGGDHCLVTPVATCTTTLNGTQSGMDYKNYIFNFLTKF